MNPDSDPLDDQSALTFVDTIAPDDGMIERSVPSEEAREHYFNVGRSALRCVRVALAAGQRTNVKKILDLPCGHGRVLRMLKAGFPDAEIHACDLLISGVEFCQRIFGATAIPSQTDPKRIPLQGPYDLIWVGSLFTHFDSPRWVLFLDILHQALAPNGVCVITTHGRWAAQLIRSGSTGYGLPNPGKLLSSYDRTGFAYEGYPHAPDYGISLSSISWVANQIARVPQTRVISVIERGWAMHQDVVAWQKTDW